MNWYRITLIDGSSCFYELDMNLAMFKENLDRKSLAKINRSLMLLPHNQNGKQGLIAVAPNKVNPMYTSCDEKTEYICMNKIVSFAVVNIESESWNKIYDSVYNESNLARANMKLVIPE